MLGQLIQHVALDGDRAVEQICAAAGVVEEPTEAGLSSQPRVGCVDGAPECVMNTRCSVEPVTISIKAAQVDEPARLQNPHVRM